VADIAGTATLQLTASEAATVRQELQLLLDTLSRDEADQVKEIQALLARLPSATSGGAGASASQGSSAPSAS